MNGRDAQVVTGEAGAARAARAQAGIGLALAGGFLAFAIATGAAEMAGDATALPRWALAVAVAAAVAAVATVAAGRAGQDGPVARLAWGASLAYVAALKAAGLAFAPWLALALVALAAWRAPPRAGASLPWLHAMGTLAGLYVALTAERWLEGVAAFPRALAGLVEVLG